MTETKNETETKEEEWEQVQGGEIFTFQNPNDTFTGTYQGSRPATFGNAHDFIDGEGNPITIFGTTVLEARLASVNEGDKVKIVFTGFGTPKPGQNPPKLFDVFVQRKHE